MSAWRVAIITAGLSVAAVASAQPQPVYGWTNFVGQSGRPGSLDGLGGAARFDTPRGVAFDAFSSNLYVADTAGHTIRKVTLGGQVTTLAGQGGISGSDDGTGNAARFNAPGGLVVDGTGTIYVADTGNHTVRKVTPAGEVTTLAGLAGSAGSEDGAGSAARFNEPAGLAVDAAGILYVADRLNHAIRRVTAAGEVTLWAGMAGSAGSADGPGSTARFDGPVAAAAGSLGTLYVADQGNQTLRTVTPEGVVSTLAGRAENAGTTDGVGDAARFNNPSGVALDSLGILYVTDLASHTVRRVTPEGVVTTIGGEALADGVANGLGSSARFSGPAGVAVGSAGTVYVADSGNHRLARGGPIFAPVLTTQPVGRTNNLGTRVSFSVEVSGSDPLSYQWRLDEADLPGATNASLTLPSLLAVHAGAYSVLVTNLAGWTVSSNAVLAVNQPPTVSIASPTNGAFMLATAGSSLAVSVTADATDDVGLAQVEFWSDSHSLGVVTTAPWRVLQLDVPAGDYHFTAVAVDTLGLVSTSAVSVLTVLSEPPATVGPLVTAGLLVSQTGLFYQTVRLSNPTATPIAAVRLWLQLDPASLARGVRVWNATGQSNGLPYFDHATPLAPGEGVDLLLEYYVPDRRPFPSPGFRTEVVVPEPSLEPGGSPLNFVRQVQMTNGLFLVEFSTRPGQEYYVQYGSDMTHWKTALPVVLGNGTQVQWVDTGPPKTDSQPASATNRFYRVLTAP